MATTSVTPAAAGIDLQESARRHLWMHFSRMGGYDSEHEIPIIARAEGNYVWDDHGNRYLDALSALFCCNAGHGRVEYGEAAAAQIKELDFYTNWSYAHPRAIELAERIAHLAPGDLNHVFFTNSGSEAVEAAIKVARNWHRAHGRGQRTQDHLPRGRLPRHHHGRADRHRHHLPQGPLRADHAGRVPRSQHQPSALAHRPRLALGCREGPRSDRVRGAGHRGGRDPRAVAERRRLHSPAGGLLPTRAGDLRRVRRPADLRRGDLFLGPARPLLRLSALRLSARHHHHGEGAHRCLHPDGGDDHLRRGVRAIRLRHSVTSPTARRSAAIRSPPRSPSATSTYSPTRISAGRSSRNEAEFRQMLEDLRDIPIVGDVRGAGYFHAIELVKDRETMEHFNQRRFRVAPSRLPLG